MTDSTPSGPSAVPPRKGQRGRNQGRPASGPARRPSGGSARREAVAAQRRRRNYLLSGGAIAVVIIVIVVLVIVKAGNGGIGGSSKANASSGGGVSSGTPVAASDVESYTSVPLSRLAAAASSYKASDLAYPQLTSGAALASGGKPQVLYVGGEFCPFCAAERWALVLALSKFGTFSNLSSTKSAVTDGDYSTWTFYGSTYTSKYVTFTPVEYEDRDRRILQKLTPAESQVFSSLGGNSFPFVDIGGKAIVNAAAFDPRRIGTLSFQQIAAQVEAGTTSLAAAIYASAGALISDICHVTGGAPSDVCSAFPSPITS